MKNQIHSFWRMHTFVFIVMLLIAVVASCTTATPSPQTSTPQSPISTSQPPSSALPPATSAPETSGATRAMAEDIATDVGKITQVNEGSSNIIMVFEETHDSPAGQTEIAIMMNRLLENYGMKQIALEGYFKESGKLDASWFQNLPPFVAKELIREREDVIVQLLQDGEISSSEMMALTYNDVAVTGIEIPEEYNFELSDDASSAPILYLYSIAAPGLTNDEINKANELFNANKTLEGVELIINTDEWTSKEYALINDDTKIISAEEWLQILDEIEAKAANVDVSDYKQGMDNLRKFYETASQRSRTMVDNTLEISKTSPNTPVAMVIGAAHTELVAKLFTDKGVSFAIIRGNALDKGSENGDLSYNAYDRKNQKMSVDSPGSLGALLDGRKKPQPVVNEPWFHSKAQIYFLTDILANAAAAGKTPPFNDVLDKLPEFDGVSLDKSSITIKDGDVIFSVRALGSDGKEVTVWVRTRTDAEAVEKYLEDRLQDALKDVQSKDAPSNEDEKTPSEPELMAISSTTIAEFSTDQSLVLSSDI